MPFPPSQDLPNPGIEPRSPALQADFLPIPVFWSSDANKQLTGKVPDAGKDVGQEKKMSEDEMAGYINNAMNRNLGQLWEM